MLFTAFLAAVAAVAAGIASITGFGTGSLLTPTLAMAVGTNLAVAAISIVFGIVVALAGISELTGWMRRVRWGRRSASSSAPPSGLVS
jgi:uncharacterized membrane protein YfcA